METGLGGTWSVDGTILAARAKGRDLIRISPGGETTEVADGWAESLVN